MDDMNAFERQVAGETVRAMGPIRPVDDLAMFNAATTTPQPPMWTFQSMFSATKFVLAAAIVALFGGFVLISQPFGQQPAGAPGAASASAVADSPAIALPEGRSGHTATRLSDGRVLTVGGTQGDRLGSAEIWDPTTGTLEPGGLLAELYEDHTATLLADGRVLIVGTRPRQGSLASAEIWDPATRTFEPGGSLAARRNYHTATLLADGRVLVVGDKNPRPETVLAEVWDPVTGSFSPASAGSFSPIGSEVRGRMSHTATLLSDGRVLVVGGTNKNGHRFAAAEVWDPAIASFSAAGSQTRMDHTATLLPDGRVLVIGGYSKNGKRLASAEIWDPATATFGPAGTLDQARVGHTATLLSDGSVLVAGGGHGNDRLASTEVWDPATGSFVPAPSLAQARMDHTATVLPDDRVLYIGGGRTEVWDPND